MLLALSSALAAGAVGFAVGCGAALLFLRSGIGQKSGAFTGKSANDIDRDTVRHRLRLAGHDLRSSLGPVVGYADLIKISNDISQAQLHADKITQAAGKIESVANNLTESVLGPEDA